ncbi:trypsin-like serine protease-like protein [Mauternbach virus]|uniref:Trypsin-like serine protease-like protein n=1 Tax=Mauternbach virus TaxID=2486603 RepID=A0A3G3E641_9VIRU|nr:trypsin-like serine protease-like protein [Mauternbach virus]AYP97939.1 trypsin-like serine protease-like protein [Mauternbach virus]
MVHINRIFVRFVLVCSLSLSVFCEKNPYNLPDTTDKNENYVDIPLNFNFAANDDDGGDDEEYEGLVNNEIILDYTDDIPKDSNNRIFNGVNAPNGLFPAQAQLIIKLADGRSFQCGGSLVDRHWILTSASCLIYSENINWIVAVLGTSILNSSSRVLTNATNLLIHKNYFTVADNPNDDIALVRINGVRFTKEIQPVILTAKSSDYSGQCAYVTGFGDNGVAQTKYKLYYGTVQMAKHDVCFSQLEDIRSLLCAKTSRLSSTCPGDEGSPLYLRESDGSWEQIGISLYRTVFSCEDEAPVSFTNVALYIDWIFNTIDKYSSSNPKIW